MTSATTTAQPATRIRYGVLGFACALSAITYLDRLAMGASQSHLLSALGLHNVAELRATFTAFTLAYAVFEVPTGYLGDVFGPRTTLIRIVLWWSFFTALTALTGIKVAGMTLIGFEALVVIRFLFGMGEAGAYPNITRALHNWFPVTERGMAQGLVWMSGRLLGGLTPLVWMFLVEWIGLSWRFAFVLFGLIGVIWCIAFARSFRNRPEENRDVNAVELEVIREGTAGATEQAHTRVRWGELLRNWNVWALCLMYFTMAYGWYFNVFYLPAYMEDIHGVAKDSFWGSISKGGPLLLGAVGCVTGGWLTDWFLRRTGNRRWSRRVLGMFGHGVCVPLYLYCTIAPSAWTFAVAIALTGFFNDLAMGSAWATCQDIGRRHAAIVAGCMNTIGNLGGATAGWVVGELLLISQRRFTPPGVEFADLSPEARRAILIPGFDWSFYSFAGMYALAIVLWLCIDATKPAFREDAA